MSSRCIEFSSCECARDFNKASSVIPANESGEYPFHENLCQTNQETQDKDNNNVLAHHPVVSQKLSKTPSKAYPNSNFLDAIKQ